MRTEAAPHRWRWRLPGRILGLGERTRVMGILNVTPDSFSDGGRHAGVSAAVAHAHRLARAGADFLDIGGESTRPGSQPVAVAEEIRRVVPVIEALRGELEIPVSIDTRKASVARAALAAGAEIVNDVTGLQGDPEMARVVADTGAAVIVMHMRGEPATMQAKPRYADLFGEVAAFLSRSLEIARTNGIDPEAVVLDPGIGFGKTLEHNLTLLAHPDALARMGHPALERPMLVGVSRKSMFGTLLGLEVHQREEATLAAVAISAFLGVAIVRVHDVRGARRAAGVADAVRRARDLGNASNAMQETLS